MIAIQKFDMHLDRPEKKLRICGVQGDTLSRGVCFRMYQNNRAWIIPKGTRVAVWYVKEDRTGGMYDALPDGAQAWRAEGNALTVYLAPQMFTAAGEVRVQLELKCGEAVLRSFAFALEVSRCLPLAEGSRDYFRRQYDYLPMPESGEVGQFLMVTEVNGSGKITMVDAADAPTVPGADGKSAYQYAREAGYTGTEEEFGQMLANPAGLPQPESAAPGRYIVVDAVDEDGRVTAVRAIENPVTDEYINSLIDAKLADIEVLPDAEGVGF